MAQQLYEETPESLAAREAFALRRRLAPEPAATIEQGRPTKRDRRQLAEWDRWSASIGPDEPTWQSVEALNQLVACLAGETIEKWHEIPISLITEENLGDFVKPSCPDDVWANTKMDYETIKTLYKCTD